jgi:hypothetical protein
VPEDINKLGIETQAELQAQGLDVVEERDLGVSDKPAPVNGAASLSNGHDDGAHEPASWVEVCGLVVPNDNYEAAWFWRDNFGLNTVPRYAHKNHPSVLWKALQERMATDEELISWRARFEGGVGFITGAISNRVVIDTDGPEGEAVLREYAAEHGELPKTLTCRSGSGRGYHRHYKHPGFKVKTVANTEIKVDIKGDGGFASLPPTIHSKSGKPYAVVSDTFEVADLPEGLLEFIEAKAAAAKLVAKAAKEKTREGIAKEVKREFKKYPVRETALSPDEKKQYEKYADAAIKGEADNITQAVAYDKEGHGRNRTLFKAMCKLGWFVHHGIAGIEVVKAALHEAFLKTRTAEELSDEYQVALDEEEFNDTINSGLKYSKDDPLRDINAKPELSDEETLRKALAWLRRHVGRVGEEDDALIVKAKT